MMKIIKGYKVTVTILDPGHWGDKAETSQHIKLTVGSVWDVPAYVRSQRVDDWQGLGDRWGQLADIVDLIPGHLQFPKIEIMINSALRCDSTDRKIRAELIETQNKHLERQGMLSTGRGGKTNGKI
jgi:hypothetical protein